MKSATYRVLEFVDGNGASWFRIQRRRFLSRHMVRVTFREYSDVWESQSRAAAEAEASRLQLKEKLSMRALA